MRIKWGRVFLALAVLIGIGYFAINLFTSPSTDRVADDNGFRSESAQQAQQPAPQSNREQSQDAPRSEPASGQSGQSGQPVVRVGFDAFASYYPVILIEQLGLDDKYGFQIELVPFCTSDSDCYSEDERGEMMNSGALDVLLTTIDKPALDPSVGIVTTLVDETDGADMIVSSANVRTFNDLVGTGIAYAEGSVGEFFVYYLLATMQIKPSQVTLVPAADVDEATAMFTDGFVDAVSGWEPNIDPALETGSRLIDSGRLRVVVDVIVSSHRSVNERRDAIQAFHYAWFEAVRMTFDEPNRAEDVVIGWGSPDWTGVATSGDLTGWLETIAQAGLGANQFAMSDPSLIAERLEEASHVWQAAGRVVDDVDFNTIVDPSFVLSAAENPSLFNSNPPINDSFLLTNKPDTARLTEEELGASRTLAVLPLRKIDFEADSARLTETGQGELRGQVIPVLQNSTGIYLKIDGSAAHPGPRGRFTSEGIRQFAERRARSVAQFLSNNGIDPDRLILGTREPQFPLSTREDEREQDRFVEFTLIEPPGR